MRIKSLKISNFRNLKDLNLNFSDNLNIFVGLNGQGKTNLLEAIYILLEGESFRYGNNETIIQKNRDFSTILCTLVSNQLEYKLKLNIGFGKKEFFINDKKTIISKSPLPPVILFSPESLNIIKESADHRRSLIDQVLIQTFQNGRLIIHDFKKALRTRNKLLKDISSERIPLNEGKAVLESLNPSYLRLCIQLTTMRLKALSEIKSDVQTALINIHGLNNAVFNYNYIISEQNIQENDADLIGDLIKKRMQELALAELKSGTSLVGPHKHDIMFLYSGNDSRFFCSQGQQRSIILAFKMAQIVYHHKVHKLYPVLLLDDVLSELDLSKQGSLISTLNQITTQTFLTSADNSVLEKLSLDRSFVFTVKDGNILEY